MRTANDFEILSSISSTFVRPMFMVGLSVFFAGAILIITHSIQLN